MRNLFFMIPVGTDCPICWERMDSKQQLKAKLVCQHGKKWREVGGGGGVVVLTTDRCISNNRTVMIFYFFSFPPSLLAELLQNDYCACRLLPPLSCHTHQIPGGRATQVRR